MDREFPEPRGWALRWEGSALFPAADCVSHDDGAQMAPAGWGLQWRQVTAASVPGSRNGIGRNGLSRPLGWALKWDGAALVETVDPHESMSLGAAEREKEDLA